MFWGFGCIPYYIDRYFVLWGPYQAVGDHKPFENIQFIDPPQSSPHGFISSSFQRLKEPLRLRLCVWLGRVGGLGFSCEKGSRLWFSGEVSTVSQSWLSMAFLSLAFWSMIGVGWHPIFLWSLVRSCKTHMIANIRPGSTKVVDSVRESKLGLLGYQDEKNNWDEFWSGTIHSCPMLRHGGGQPESNNIWRSCCALGEALTVVVCAMNT